MDVPDLRFVGNKSLFVNGTYSEWDYGYHLGARSGVSKIAYKTKGRWDREKGNVKHVKLRDLEGLRLPYDRNPRLLLRWYLQKSTRN